ncbi:FkbM family methyltransferase [Synechococcus sp. W60.2]|uniref:FkbM family methyltransferase n=1 Tax=unclassified Synechococcus TaxID=2626047 RepID=UPI0039C45863
MGIPTTADECNELGISHCLKAQQAKTSRERRAAWALALAAWRQGLDLDPNHLPCQFNRLHALLALGSYYTALQEGKELLSRLLTQRYLEDPSLGLTGSQPKLAWDPPRLASASKKARRSSKAASASRLGPRERYLHTLARWLAHNSGVVYRPEPLPYWRLAAAIDPEDLEAQMVVAMNAAAQAQPEGAFLLQKIADHFPGQKDRALQVLQLALDRYIPRQDPSKAESDSEPEAETPPEKKPTSDAVAEIETWAQYEGYKLRLEPDLKSIATFVLLAQDRWFESEIELCRQILKPGMKAIDVGANVGVYTFLFARCVGKTGKVYAIEPTPGCVQCLRATVAQNKLDQSVQVVEAAVGEESREVYLVCEGASVFNRIVTDPMSVVEETKPVQQVTLDELWISEGSPNIDLVKIDAEGAEVPVLKGGRKLIETCAPVILFENQSTGQFSGLESAKLLAEWGYLIYVYNPVIQDLSTVQASVQMPTALNLVAVHPRRFSWVSEAGLI